MRSVLGLICFLIISQGLYSQYALTPRNLDHQPLLERYYATADINLNTAFAPVMMPLSVLDSIYDADTENWTCKQQENKILRLVRNEHLLTVEEEDFNLHFDVGLNLEGSRQVDDQGRRLFTNTRGVQVIGTVGERVFFGSSFYENQSIFPNYLDSIVSLRGDLNNEADPERGSVPGFGRWKPFNTSDSYDYDYTLGTGYIGVAINDRSFIQFGHDRQFLGYGYRSMLLSDVSSPYPFIRTHLSFWGGKISYSSTWAVLQSLERVAPNYNDKEAMFRRLGARFTYLHFQPRSWFGIGFFDGSTWTWRDNSHPSGVEYYLPYSGLAAGNSIRLHLMGFNGFVRPIDPMTIYGQWAVQTSAGAMVGQLGAKWTGLPAGLQVTLEWNHTGEAGYFNGEGASQTTIIAEPLQEGTNALDYYQHNDHSLGHPLMVASDEWLARVQYRLRDFVVRASYHRVSKYPMFIDHTQDFFQFEAGYIVKPKTNLQVVLGNINRTERNGVYSMIDTYTYFAIRTNLFNNYRDF